MLEEEENHRRKGEGGGTRGGNGGERMYMAFLYENVIINIH